MRKVISIIFLVTFISCNKDPEPPFPFFETFEGNIYWLSLANYPGEKIYGSWVTSCCSNSDCRNYPVSMDASNVTITFRGDLTYSLQWDVIVTEYEDIEYDTDTSNTDGFIWYTNCNVSVPTVIFSESVIEEGKFFYQYIETRTTSSNCSSPLEPEPPETCTVVGTFFELTLIPSNKNVIYKRSRMSAGNIFIDLIRDENDKQMELWFF